MKIIPYIFLLVCSSLIYSQEYKLESNPNWYKYSKVIEINPSFPDSKNEYTLMNGRVINFNTFSEDSLVFSQSYLYDKHNNVEMRINNLSQDTLNYENFYPFDDLLESNIFGDYHYDEKGRLVEVIFSHYLHYNEEGQIERIIFFYELSHSGKFKSIKSYNYDKCGNAIEVKSIEEPYTFPYSSPSDEYNFENAIIKEFHYKYKNRNCIWTERYIIENGKKKMIAKRILKN